MRKQDGAEGSVFEEVTDLLAGGEAGEKGFDSDWNREHQYHLLFVFGMGSVGKAAGVVVEHRGHLLSSRQGVRA